MRFARPLTRPPCYRGRRCCQGTAGKTVFLAASETCVELTSSPHIFSRMFFTLRVETPCTYISAIAMVNALSERRLRHLESSPAPFSWPRSWLAWKVPLFVYRGLNGPFFMNYWFYRKKITSSTGTHSTGTVIHPWEGHWIYFVKIYKHWFCLHISCIIQKRM